MEVTPVIVPARLPETGSEPERHRIRPVAVTMGMVTVARFAASAAFCPPVTIRST